MVSFWFHLDGRVAQWAVTLASAPMVVGSIPALCARVFWVPPCSASVFRSFHYGFPPSSLYSKTLVSVLHCTSVPFTVLRAVPAEKTVRSYRLRSLLYRLSLVREIKKKIHSFIQIGNRLMPDLTSICSFSLQVASNIYLRWDFSAFSTCISQRFTPIFVLAALVYC